MISRFPRPFEDELIWSTVARYLRRIGPKASAFASTLLLGHSFRRLDPLLPSYIELLCRKIPPEFQLDPCTIRDRHTLYRIAAAGLPSDAADRLSKLMLGEKPDRRKAYISRRHLRAHPTYRLKYCPECRRLDLQKFGEAGWRTWHQIPGVACCDKHKCALVETPVTAYVKDPIPLDQIEPDGNPMSQDPLSREYAEQAHLLCSYRGKFPPADTISMALVMKHTVPDDKDKRCRPCERASRTIIQSLPSVASHIGSTSNAEDGTVEYGLMAFRKTIGPVILLSATVANRSTIPETISLAENLRHDERPPFPCVNRLCGCFGQDTIWRPRLECSYDPPRAVFSCPKCGLSYSRPLPLTRKSPKSPDFEWTTVRPGKCVHDREPLRCARLESRRNEYLALAAKHPAERDAQQKKRLRSLRNTMLLLDREWLARHSEIRHRRTYRSRRRRRPRVDWKAYEKQMLHCLDEISKSAFVRKIASRYRLTIGFLIEALREYGPLTYQGLWKMPVLQRQIRQVANSLFALAGNNCLGFTKKSWAIAGRRSVAAGFASGTSAGTARDSVIVPTQTA